MFLIGLPYERHNSFDLSELQTVICRKLGIFSDPNEIPGFFCKKHIQECEWFFIYDFIEGLYKTYMKKPANIIRALHRIRPAGEQGPNRRQPRLAAHRR